MSESGGVGCSAGPSSNVLAASAPQAGRQPQRPLAPIQTHQAPFKAPGQQMQQYTAVKSTKPPLAGKGVAAHAAQGAAQAKAVAVEAADPECCFLVLYTKKELLGKVRFQFSCPPSLPCCVCCDVTVVVAALPMCTTLRRRPARSLKTASSTRKTVMQFCSTW